MQLTDGSTRVKTSACNRRTRTANSLAIYDTLYDACITHPGQTPMTLQVMPAAGGSSRPTSAGTRPHGLHTLDTTP